LAINSIRLFSVVKDERQRIFFAIIK